MVLQSSPGPVQRLGLLPQPPQHRALLHAQRGVEGASAQASLNDPQRLRQQLPPIIARPPCQQRRQIEVHLLEPFYQCWFIIATTGLEKGVGRPECVLGAWGLFGLWVD